MKLIVGIGNPGSKYLKNRHNVGHMFVDYVNEQVKSDPFDKTQGHPELGRMDEKLKVKSYSSNFKFMKTNCYMNLSGQFVKKLIRHSSLDISHLVIVHDDLDIPLGKYKIQFGSGPKLHNGILSIEEALGTKNFRRIRIGIDSCLRSEEGEDYVLQDFTHNERKIVQTVFKQIVFRLATYETI